MTSWGAGRAGRLEHRPWRDPRVLVGAVLVLVSATIGALVVASGDESRDFWAVRDGVEAGQPLRTDDLVRTSAVLDDDAARRALAVTEALPAAARDLVWSTDVPDGQLVARTDLQQRRAARRTDLPVVVPAGSAPQGLGVGDRVDVGAGPGPGDPVETGADRVLSGVRVVGLGGRGAQGGRSLTLDVADVSLPADSIARLAAQHLTVVRVP